jgi:hypothetical protein
MLRIFERGTLRRNYDSVKKNVIWRSRDDHEFYKLRKEPNTVRVIKAGRLRWLYTFIEGMSRALAEINLHKPEGTE